MKYIYSWVPAYSHFASQLLKYRNNQPELISILQEIGININNDEDRPKHSILLQEIDPFTFLFYLSKPKNTWNKISVLRALCRKWNFNGMVYDVCGIPSGNARRLHLFKYKYERGNEIDTLWRIFESLLNGSMNETLYQEFLASAMAQKTKLTESLFLVDPFNFLCINAKVRPYLESKGINPSFSSYAELIALYSRIKDQLQIPFTQISFEAHIQDAFPDRKPNYFRIGTTAGENGESILPEMISFEIASIGWKKLSNIELIEPINKKHIANKLLSENYYPTDKGTATRKAGEILLFYKEILPGDIVLGAEGAKIKAIGKVISDHYIYDDQLQFPHAKCVDWIYKDVSDLQINEGLRTSVWQYKEPASLKLISKYLSKNRTQPPHATVQDNRMNPPLNTILHGPPGTGKTFHSISYAVAIAENKPPVIIIEEANLNREVVKKRYDKLVREGQVIFTTFHQNMSYEDFIEGIKPVEPEEDDAYLKYEIQDGLFMRACIEASYNYIQKNFKRDQAVKELLDFNSLYDRLYERVSNNGDEELKTKSGGIVTASVTSKGNFSIIHDEREKAYTVSRGRLARIYEHNRDPKNIPNVHEAFRKAIGGCNSTAYWSVLNAIAEIRDGEKLTNKSLENTDAILPYEDKRKIVQQYWDKMDCTIQNNDLSTPYVFIIDEINRGNVAQIFGELITLIEDDKRMGKTETIYVELPYSKNKFAVPPNLHIIGTMNTADRSVEALDTALRRRFSFTPKMPDETLLKVTSDGIELGALLASINKRLKVLKDPDHTVGHAWLLNVNNLDELKSKFTGSILPLLQEYFYNDYEKLGLVLGDGFFIPKPEFSINDFATFSRGSELAAQYDQRSIYELKPLTDWTAEDFKAIYK